jgi:hypothetical protein
VAAKLSKKVVLVEIQVRTIFEEGWSEIDHLIRYPYVKDNPILEQYLVMFNRLAGSADEMGTFLLSLKTYLEQQDEIQKNLQGELTNKEGELRRIIRKLRISSDEKRELDGKIAALSKSSYEYTLPSFGNLSGKGTGFLSIPQGSINNIASISQTPTLILKCKICGKEISSNPFPLIFNDGKCDNCRLTYVLGIGDLSGKE